MTGHEFTRFESDFTSKQKASSYDAGTVAFQIKQSNPGLDFKTIRTTKTQKIGLLKLQCLVIATKLSTG